MAETQQAQSTLHQLLEAGQSYWLDDLSRQMIHSGELKRRVEEEGLRGITSNPDIFSKAIEKGTDYDEQIRSLRERKDDIIGIYKELVISDIQEACDILRPVYDESEGVDGMVSLEVNPHFARATTQTMDEARELHGRVDRPNLLIKIPGTREGLPAIEEMLFEGININITLIFSVRRYEEVADAYIRALKRREEAGRDVSSARSVASFFLSRIDVMVDELLRHRIPEPGRDTHAAAKVLLGRAAIANARLAYDAFQRIFGSSEWNALAAKGAKVQRPLWASTSTKNPDYPDTMYVEPLIGPDTVNTMPSKTIEAFADHGAIKPNSILDDLDKAQEEMKTLAAIGIDIEEVAARLEDEGIQKFIDPFDGLLDNIRERVEKA